MDGNHTVGAIDAVNDHATGGAGRPIPRACSSSGTSKHRGDADQADRSLSVHGVGHAHGVVPVHERGHDHGDNHDHGHDHDHVHGSPSVAAVIADFRRD